MVIEVLAGELQCAQPLAIIISEIHHKCNITSLEVCIKS